MDFLGESKISDEENWQYVELSKIDDKIIKSLIDNLKLDLSETFYISFESLLKLGKRATNHLDLAIKEMDEIHKYKKELFKLLLKYIRTQKIEDPSIFQLYHPDFLIRAKAVKKIENKIDSAYVPYLLLSLEDPDDSIRWAVINLLKTHYLKNPKVHSRLKKHIKKESNPIIRKKLIEFFD